MSFEPQNWPLVKLSDLITVKHGFAFKGEFFSDEPTGLQLTTPGNFAIGGGFQLGKGKFYSGEYPTEYVLKNGDLIVTMTDLSKAADTLGYAAIVPETEGTIWLHNQRVGLVQIKKDAPVALDFLHYLMRTADYRRWVVSTATGSTVKHTSPSRICDYEFRLPPIWLQGEIGRILTAHDDRIALLRETNATLEAIAQALFKSWFVDFDPVHANAGVQATSLPPEIQAIFPTTFTDSAQGLIPEGWSTGTLGDVAETSRKQLKPEQLSAETLYVGLEHIPRKQLGLDTWSTAEDLASAKSAFERSDILFGKLRPYFHKVVVAPIDGVCSTDILVCKSKQTSYHHFVALHLFSDELISYADRLSNGAKMPRINWKDLAAYEVVIPPNEIAEEFQSLVEPMINRILANVEQAKTLSLLRDTLLPRLISGQLCLPEADQAIEECID